MFKKKKTIIGLAVPAKAGLMVAKGDRIKAGQELWLENKIERVKVEAMADLPLKQVKEWVAKNEGRSFEEGEVMYRGGFLGKNKRKCMVAGEVCGVDEFGKIELLVNKQKISFGSPVAGKIVMADKEKVELEFGAVEYEGEVSWDGWVWSQVGLVEVSEADRLSELVEDKMVLVRVAEIGFVLKAAVLGAVGVVTEQNLEQSEESELPVFVVSGSDYKEIAKNETKVVRVGIDGSGGKLYLVE